MQIVKGVFITMERSYEVLARIIDDCFYKLSVKTNELDFADYFIRSKSILIKNVLVEFKFHLMRKKSYLCLDQTLAAKLVFDGLFNCALTRNTSHSLDLEHQDNNCISFFKLYLLKR